MLDLLAICWGGVFSQALCCSQLLGSLAGRRGEQRSWGLCPGGTVASLQLYLLNLFTEYPHAGPEHPHA